MAIGDIIVGLDLGVSKVSCVVGQVNKFSEIEVIGYGLSNNSGIKKGQIIDPQNVALSIRKAIEEIILVEDSKKIHFTVSVGLVKREVNETLDMTLEKADKLLYEAKSSGRNQTKFRI